MKKKEIVGVLSIIAGVVCFVEVLRNLINIAPMIHTLYGGSDRLFNAAVALLFLFLIVLILRMLIVRHDRVAEVVCGKSGNQRFSFSGDKADVVELVLLFVGVMAALDSLGMCVNNLIALFNTAIIEHPDFSRRVWHGLIGSSVFLVFSLAVIFWRSKIALFIVKDRGNRTIPGKRKIVR